MFCHLIRHGKDDDTVRGGWSNIGLTEYGVEQVHKLGAELKEMELDVDCIYASDLQRAKETAEIIAEYLQVPINYRPEFRETNNGDLAGMKNEEAAEKYPGMYWSTLEYDQCYPNGESPETFYKRVEEGWEKFKEEVKATGVKNVVLVTHGGVIEAILCKEKYIKYSNKTKNFAIGAGKMISIGIN